jgi:hypothetical protein
METASPRLIEVQVVSVGGIVVRRKRGAEYSACGIACRPQESGRRVSTAPVAQDGNPPTVGKLEGRDVDSIARRMLAPIAILTATDPAAVCRPQVFECDYSGPQHGTGGGLDTVSEPHR